MKEYLSVGEMSKLFNLNKQTLQYYDKEGIFCPEYRDPKNQYRMYRFDQVYGLALICYLRKIGFSIVQIKNYQNLHNSDAAMQELKAQSKLLQQHCQHLLEMDHVLQRKLHYIERTLHGMQLEEAEIRTFPKRKYIPLGKEPRIYNNDVFYFYPTIAFLHKDAQQEKTEISFGAYLAQEDAVPVRYIDNIGDIDSGRYLCASFKGPHDATILFADKLRKCYPTLELSPDSVNFNIIDQFIESEKEKYITQIQIRILE